MNTPSRHTKTDRGLEVKKLLDEARISFPVRHTEAVRAYSIDLGWYRLILGERL